jgi:hypothetical protein
MRLTRKVIHSGVPGWDGRKYEKLAKRVGALDSPTLFAYADQAGTGMHRAFSDLRRHGLALSLDEIDEGLMTLWAVARELRTRYEDSPGSD